MFSALKKSLDRFRGFGDYALSVPNLDGAFKPNDLLEGADEVVAVTAPDNIVHANGRVFLSSGNKVLVLSGSSLETFQDGSSAVTAMAAAPDGRLAIARSGQSIMVQDASGQQVEIKALVGQGDVTALCFEPDGNLAVAIGAKGRAAGQWREDLMARGSNGAVFRLSANGTAQEIAADLPYPNGIVGDGQGGLLVSLAWESSLVRLSAGRKPVRILENLPGYPSRIIASGQGGYWLSIFAPRNQLVEFVLREETYRNRMIREIEPEYWVCPALAPATSPLEVMQDGAQKIGGSIKPWAPSLSYGLVVRIDDKLLPQFSYHSRANGQRHGVTSMAETPDGLLVTTHGGAAVVRLPSGK